jgi:hypothetical protein
MKHLSILILFFSLFTLIQCGGSQLEEGDTYYASGDFTRAVNSYLAYKKANPQAKDINSKICLAYFNKGKDLFRRSRNIESYSGNFTKAQEYLDDTFTPEQKAEYSRLLYDFAIAYRKTKADNDIKQEEYFNNTLDYLQSAIDMDPENTTADSMLSAIYLENFQQMFDKGVKSYNKAKKEKNNVDSYLKAERYFKKAVQFNSSSEEAAQYLSNTRKETIGILESIEPLSFCVTGYKMDKNSCFIALAAKNYSNDVIAVDLNAITLNTEQGDVINVDMKKTAELEKALAQNTQIKPFELIEGQLVYTLQPNTKLQYIAYNIDDKSVRKYFP